jgi:hypothetical protein
VLCRVHADQADNGALTDDQLRAMKELGLVRAETIGGRFNWMRNDLLAVVGGNFFYDESVILEVGGVSCVWFDRDSNNDLLLSFRMPSLSGQPRATIHQNFWYVPPTVEELICPPHGRLIDVRYQNGDHLRVECSTAATVEELSARYPDANVMRWPEFVRFPLTTVEVWETAVGTPIQLGPKESRFGNSTMKNGFFARNRVAVSMECPPGVVKRIFPLDSIDGRPSRAPGIH